MAVDTAMPVLIVDDYKTMLSIIRHLLGQLGFDNVEEATDGATALAKLRAKSFGLVISDWNMEPVSGLDLLREIRSDDTLKDLPFVMITAVATSDSVIAAKQAGTSNYIVKPFTAATLKQRLAAILGSF